ncbi:MAG: ankyrin repeat domain-containing protein, partial [Chlamydiia bacterium]|nr:ankyrin repeat domain-containing protein [Chlamydiia bacterium]
EKLTILASTAATGGVSLLGLAAFGGREEIVKFLINVFEDRSSLQFELQKKLSEGFTPLWLAAVKGHLSIVELILDCFDTPEERYSCLCQRATSISKTSIDYAASEGNSDVIGYLLNQLDPRQRLGLLLQEDGYDRNPLMLATINGNASCIHALLDPLTPQEQAMYLKAANSSRSTPLLGAIQKAKTVSIDALLLHCTPDFTPADYIRSPIDEDCHTALHYAAEQPDKESLSVLLAHLSAEEDSLISCLEARSRLGYAALHSACRSKDGGPAALELLNTMHSLGLDTGSRTVFGETPLHLAAREGLSEVVQWYMTHAPQQFELRSHYGSTACELALMYRQDSLLSLLQEKGVIPQSEDPRLDPLYGAAPVAIGQTLLIDRLIRYLKASGWLTEDLLK